VAVSRQFSCSAEDVFAVLADGWVYPVWVVGASRMRAVDDDWPGVGSRLHHSAGAWPLLIDDTSEVLAYQPPRAMVLQARGWPAGEARVEITVEPSGTGCLVSIDEDASSGPALFVPSPVRHALMAVRNRETLRRLAFLAEGHARS
jgi:hypothetical protein